jgi:sulfur relay (sulfurtransferase) DsrC/TusE family protein
MTTETKPYAPDEFKVAFGLDLAPNTTNGPQKWSRAPCTITSNEIARLRATVEALARAEAERDEAVADEMRMHDLQHAVIMECDTRIRALTAESEMYLRNIEERQEELTRVVARAEAAEKTLAEVTANHVRDWRDMNERYTEAEVREAMRLARHETDPLCIDSEAWPFILSRIKQGRGTK